MLFEMPTAEEWWEGAKAHESRGHANYLEFMQWTRKQKRCWPALRSASIDFEKETGKAVKWDL
jgi:hypothetical protein